MRLAPLLYTLLFTLLPSPCGMAATLRIAVASNFKPVLQEITTRFEAQSHHRVKLSSASTGVLASQIRHGAPFDLFLAADIEAPQSLAALRKDAGQSAFCYAVGGLMLVGAQSSLEPLSNPSLSLAIANPATAPYGRVALEVLSRAEFRSGQSRKLVRGNNVIQAYQFFYSGAVDLALVATSLAPDGGTPIPAQWHQTLEQHALVLRPGPALDAYLKWFRSDTVRSLISQAGYRSCP